MAIFLKAKWENIIMANYAVEPEILKPYLPSGVELDLYNDKAYVSLVGFMFKHTKLFNIPIPLLGTFEEINLGFYVFRKEGNLIKRGVVFVNETIPYKAVACMANKLYKEHYTAIPTRHNWKITNETKNIQYEWKINNEWNHIKIEALTMSDALTPGGFQEFIFEHYFGYTKVNDHATEEYKINHPSWKTNKVTNVAIHCNFNKMYGSEFGYLSTVEPDSVFIAEGSQIEVEWKRNRVQL
jgi:hypothetical protein